MKLLFVSLGCDKNLVDSEEMLGLLTGNGFEIVDDETEAEAIVVNTCCFINDAKEESVNTILEMAEYKKTGSCKVLVVTGCMAQRYKNEIIEEVYIAMTKIKRIPCSLKEKRYLIKNNMMEIMAKLSVIHFLMEQVSI